MTFKKIMSAVMAGAMVLSLGVPAFASSTSSGLTLESADPYEFTVEGSTAVPAIKIVVPETVGMIANPYGLSVDLTTIGGTGNSSDVIVSPVQYIKNLSKVDVDVTATVAGYVDGEVEFATAAVTTSETKKKAFVELEMGLCNGTAAPGSYTNKAALKVLGDNENPVSLGSALTMVKSTDGTTVANNGAVGFHFTGSLTSNEKIQTTGENAQSPWNEGDVFGANVVFNFTAKTNAAGSTTTTDKVVIDNGNITWASGNAGTVTVDNANPADGDTVTITLTPAAGETITAATMQATAAGGTPAITVNTTDATHYTFTYPAGATGVSISGSITCS